MKRIAILVFLINFKVICLFAQVPDRPEKISPILIGAKIPNVNLKTADGMLIETHTIFMKKPSVVLIYRGGWCPYCNLHLSDIQNIEAKIVELGYQIIAISPDSPNNLEITSNDRALNYMLYSDASTQFIQALGIAFKASNNYVNLLLEKSEDLNRGVLPVPSVFIVDKSGLIEFEYINPDYKTRITAKLLLAVLNGLQ
ncbi:MAG: AhpC/TSA family protein [Bacteroidales bacterium]|nr:AhpC/TSA family protein [Bacteroidales bacterium]